MPSAPNHHSKWRALLARLLRLSLLPGAAASANKSPFTCTSARSSDASRIPNKQPSASSNCSTELTTTDSVGAANRSMLCSSEADHRIPFSAPSNDVSQLLLYVRLDAPYKSDLEKQARSLDALCTLCLASSAAAEMCVHYGAIDIVLQLLNSIPQPRHIAQLPVTPSPFVDNISERAIRFLYLMITSSDAGCAAALQQSTLIVKTLGKKLLRVSEAFTASTIVILCSLCCHPTASDGFRTAVFETAIPSKLVVVMQVASKDSTKRRAGRLLQLLSELEEQEQYTSA